MIIVRTLRASAQRGFVELGPFRLPCALGQTGIRALKREGDGATPRGRFPLRFAFYRPDAGRPKAALPLKAMRRSSGWCDSATDRNYNRAVALPYPASAERMWRSDGLYDVVVVVGYNERPRVKGRGSAIFMHVARDGLNPTEGCVALRLGDLRRLLAVLPRNSEIVILA